MKTAKTALALLIAALCALASSALAEEGVLILPKGLKVIEEEAFMDNDSITKVIVPEGVERIEYNAFNLCSNLTEITLPASLKENADFYGCESLTTVHAPEGSYAYIWAVYNGYIKPENGLTVLPDVKDGELVVENGMSVWQNIDGNSVYIDFAVNAPSDWSVTTDKTWIRGDEGSANQHRARISLKSNTSDTEREGTLKFICGEEEKTFIVRQVPFLNASLLSPSEIVNGDTVKYGDITLKVEGDDKAVRYKLEINESM